MLSDVIGRAGKCVLDGIVRVLSFFHVNPNILTFTGVGGAQVGGKFIRPLGEGMLPGVVVFHGYRGNSGDFFNLLPYAAAGMAVFWLLGAVL